MTWPAQTNNNPKPHNYVKVYEVWRHNLKNVAEEIISRRSSLDTYLQVVKPIIEDVKTKGDTALLTYVRKFDNPKASIEGLGITRAELARAYNRIDNKIRAALKTLASNIEKFSRYQLGRLRMNFKLVDGVRISQLPVPIPSVGCYVPGGAASYPSTALMVTIPARICGVPYVSVCTPPDRSGEVSDVVKAAFYIAGVDEVYAMGGPHAIAAMAYGTSSVRKVVKIVGPGGPYVTAAKKLVSQDVAVDMLAGATELVVYGDKVELAEDIAFELCAQSEHSTDTFVGLVTTSNSLANEVMKYIDIMVSRLERCEIIKQALEMNGFIAVCDTAETAAELIETVAPEHVYIASGNGKLASRIKYAGLISVGRYSSPVLSDYIIGVNHVLPTHGQAVLRGGLSVLDYVKLNCEVRVSKGAARRLGKYSGLIARSEGLTAHAKAAERWL